MLFVNGAGEGVEVGSDRSDEVGLDLSGFTDEEIRAFLAQLLYRLGIAAARAARVLRVGRAEFAELLRVPMPEWLFDALHRAAVGSIAIGTSAPPGGRA